MNLALRNVAPAERQVVFFGYLGVIIALAVGVAVTTVARTGFDVRSATVAFWVMAVLAVLTDARPLTTPGPRQSSAVFPSTCFSFAVLLLWGLGPAIAVQAAATAVQAWRTRTVFWRAAFNLAQFALALAAAAAILSATHSAPFAPGHPDGRDVLAVTFAVLGWIVVSHVLVSGAVSLRFRQPLWRGAFRTAGYEILSAGALLVLAALLAAAASVSAWLVPLIVVPLYAVYRTARISKEQEQLALHDPLTGLANRKAMLLRVSEQIAARSQRADSEGPRQLALLLLDIDRFKDVNDALGHGVGDRLLQRVAARLAAAARSEDLVARLGGDEFAILLPDVGSAAEARGLTQRIGKALATPVELDGMPLDVSSSIGFALYPDHGEDFQTLMQHADVAMYDAKSRGDTVAMYAPESDQNSAARLALLGDLRRALEAAAPREIELHYQPQVAIASGEVVGVEALLRWRHPEQGLVNTEELIRVAERSAVMQLITWRVLDEVIAQLATWAAAGVTPRVAVNVSVRDLQTTELADHLAERLTRYGVSAGQLQLEITEGALMADPPRVLTTLRRLDELGVGLSLDDFGTGYSSMSHLRRLPLSEVKIDRSFVIGMASDDDDASIVRSIIELANALGMRVVAEGVEDERTWRRLAAQGCHVAQGWFYARPMRADELPGWLAAYRPPRLLRAIADQAVAGA